MTVIEEIGGRFSKDFKETMAKQLLYAGIRMNVKRFIGLFTILLFAISFLLAAIIQFFFGLIPALTMPLIGAVIIIFVFYWIKMAGQSKARNAEACLPDALELVASNIRSGMTTERALFEASTEDFGVLSEELKRASRKIVTGERMDVALSRISNSINSRLLQKTIDLLIQGIKSGGRITALLFQISDSIREENAIREEIRANISMYVMMIFITAAFGAPVLFGISSYIVGIVSEQTSSQDSPMDMDQVGAVGIAGKIAMMSVDKEANPITEDFILLFASIALVVTALFSGLTIGVIQSGEEIDGVKIIPIILLFALSIFFASRFLLSELIGSIGFV